MDHFEGIETYTVKHLPIKIEDGNASDKSVNNDVLSEISKYMAAHGLGAGVPKIAQG